MADNRSDLERTAETGSGFGEDRPSVTKRDFLKMSAIAGGFSLASSGVMAQQGAESPDREPAETEIRSVDGTNVVFQYGRPVPSFDTWRQDNEEREYIDLNGAWKFRFGRDGKDPEEIGVDEGWYAKEYADDDWDEVDVPIPWDLHDTPGFDTYDGDNYGEGTAFRDGYAWYRKRISVDRSWEQQAVKLNFLAASYSARIYVNGTLVGEHEGGHTPFSLDVGDELLAGEENTIAIRVYRRPRYDDYTADDPDPVRGDGELPADPVDFWPYAGLTRDVYLEATDPVTVSKLLVDAADGQARIRAVVHNHGEKREKRLIELDPGADTGGDSAGAAISIDPDETRVVTRSVPIPDASQWQQSSPQTYTARATVYNGVGKGQLNAPGKGSVRDTLTARYGMRTVSTEGGALQVNGEQVFLRGFNWHEETGVNGRSMTEAEYDRHFERVEEANANFLRNSHYNRHPYVYEYTDEHGLFVMDEADNMWVQPDQQEIQLEYGLSRALTVTMAWNQYNCPSVILWCTQNESDPLENTEVHREWLTDMKEGIEAVDGHERPVTWASFRSNDPSHDLADVISFNEYFGYFWGENDELSETLDSMAETEARDSTPILISENGTWTHRDLDLVDDPDDPDENGTEAWQARNFEEHWEQVSADERSQFMAGYNFWVLKDYKTGEAYNRDQYNSVSTMGALKWGDRDLEPTQVFEAITEAYGDYAEE